MACFKGVPLKLFTNPKIKLIMCEGTTRVLRLRRRRIKAGEIMFEFPDCVICHADSFFLGRPIPILAIHDHLVAGHAYFVLPLDRLPPPGSLSASSLTSLGSPSTGSSPTPRRAPLIKFSGIVSNNHDHEYDNISSNNGGGNKSPFEYIRDKEGRVHMIKVVPEFIKMIIMSNNGSSPSNYGNNNNNNNNHLICSTPELQKQYKQLVIRAKDQGWSPKLETISEHNKNVIRFSPCRFIVLEWKKKEKMEKAY